MLVCISKLLDGRCRKVFIILATANHLLKAGNYTIWIAVRKAKCICSLHFAIVTRDSSSRCHVFATLRCAHVTQSFSALSHAIIHAIQSSARTAIIKLALACHSALLALLL